MPQPQPFIVGRQAEIERFDELLIGHTDYWLLNIYGPGGIGKTVVCHKLTNYAQSQDVAVATVDGIRPDHEIADLRAQLAAHEAEYQKLGCGQGEE